MPRRNKNSKRLCKVVALVWQKPNWLNLMCGSKQAEAVAHLTREISKCSILEARESPDWLTCRQLAELIIEKHDEMLLDGDLLLALVKIQDFELIRNYFSKLEKYHCMKERNTTKFYAALEECIVVYSWEPLLPYIEHLLYSKYTDAGFYVFLSSI